MERFFFGAYEDLDDIVAFLKAYNFIEFESEKAHLAMLLVKNIILPNLQKRRSKNPYQKFQHFQWLFDAIPIMNWLCCENT